MHLSAKAIVLLQRAEGHLSTAAPVHGTYVKEMLFCSSGGRFELDVYIKLADFLRLNARWSLSHCLYP